uniref:NB-ARC domain-containing protein n=2 Tax=Nelumbo nucifera TaxID=4432 RepID=A0A822Z396_NELNU|nr:TPA_asm: hypothetical protein HUJ06_013473 [Nelumbo nucifera]
MKRIKELQEGGRFDVVSDPAPPLAIEFMCDRDYQMFKSRESAKEEIKEALKDENVHVIWVYGMGGVGKTTLVKEIGKQVEKEKLFDKVVMAVVSQDPNLKPIQGEIARMLPLEFEEKEDVLEKAQKLSRKLQNEKSILIILDDMWDNLDLKQLRIPLDLDDNNQREKRGCCKILLTTRSQDVCHEMKTHPQIALDVLSEDDAWGLFKRNAGDVVEHTRALRDVAKEVARECKGLPVAIVTVAGALRDKKDLQVWEDALQEIKRVEPQYIKGLDQKVYKCVRWSYDYLDDVEIQRFFLYCCLFPEVYEIKIEQMMWYCFGAGVFENVETIEDARRRTRRIVNKLKASSLLFQGWSQDFIKMHDIVRDVAISIVSPPVAVGNRSHHDELFMVRAGKGLTEWQRMESGITKAVAGYTAISLMNNYIQKLPAADGLLESSSSGRLRTLLLQKDSSSRSKLEIPNTFFGGVIKSLTTLDRSTNIIGPSSLSPIQCLTNLRTLNLQGCRGLQQEVSVLGYLDL